MKNRQKIRYLFTYLTDPEVSIFKKLWVVAPIVYLLAPVDLIPDFLLGPGFIDDALIMLILIGKIQHDLGQYIARRNPEHGTKQDGKVIDNIEYKVHDDP